MEAEQQIIKKLEKIEREVKGIREHMVDVDSILSKDEELLLKKAREEHEKGKTISLEELEKELRE